MLESETVCRTVAETLQKLAQEDDRLTVIFKGSFDKANRTSLDSPRGPGLAAGLNLLDMVRKDYGLPLLTDVHTPGQVPETAVVCDILQIPAFLCRQTDLLAAAAGSGRTVNVKKGQFLAPADMAHVVAKLERSGAAEIWQTERGTTFGYQNLVVDMRSFPILREFGHPVIFDATHSVQLPGAGDGCTSGERRYIPVLMRAALAAGADGVFVETHPDPDHALSDGPNQVPIARLPALAEQALAAWELRRKLE